MTYRYGELGRSLEDVQGILQVQEAVGWGRYGPGPAAWLEGHEGDRKRHAKRVYLAYDGVVVVGYCEVIGRPMPSFEIGAGTAYVASIAVTPEHARRGLAQELGRHVLTALARAGFRRAVADVGQTNSASLNLNVALGARFLGPSPALVSEMSSGPALRVEHALAA